MWYFLHFRVTTTYTTPTLGVPNAVTANTYPQMLGLSEQVQALMPVPTSASNLLHSQRHTPSVHNTSHSKYPPPLIPVNGSNNNSRCVYNKFITIWKRLNNVIDRNIQYKIKTINIFDSIHKCCYHINLNFF